MGISAEVKQESSVPVQSRVSLISLAELCYYWDVTGYEIKSMSQLLSWSAELLCDVLRANGKLPVSITSVAEAKRFMEEKGLFQPSMKKRSFKKIGNAITFENLRNEGIDPKQYTPVAHKILHNKKSVEVAPETDQRRIMGVIFEEEAEERRKLEKERIAMKEKIKDHGEEMGFVPGPIKEDEEPVVIKEGGNTDEEIDALQRQQEAKDKRQLEEIAEM